ncbi:MAG: class I SAM-dependent methyltransferase [Cyclobacteriaceae bacterium]|nr:class I SAM-dependent methyltransferase [Cyclobacteriaceae bacterium]
MNQRSHWDGIGSNYQDEIFDVFKSDRNSRLKYYFEKHSNPKSKAIDFGCGVGKAFPYLSPAFSSVLGIDISSELLSIARLGKFSNVTCKRADLTSRNLVFPPTDFVFCCNVIMLPELDKNIAMIRNIHKALSSNGTAVIVVPSLESVMFSSWRLMEWYKKEGVNPSEIPASELSYYKGSKREILQGIIYIDKIPTKHYSESEIRVLFSEAKLNITALEKLEYEWNTEFDSPPSWMKAPYPWDWLIEIKKLK